MVGGVAGQGSTSGEPSGQDIEDEARAKLSSHAEEEP